MSVAAATREAVRAHPFLQTALRAGVVNYTAAARFLNVGEEEAVAAALRRYADELADYEEPDHDATVSMQSGIARIGTGDQQTDEAAEPVLVVGDVAFVPTDGDLTAVVAVGTLPASVLGDVLARLATAEVSVVAAAGTDGRLAVVVPRRAGANAVRAVEAAL